MRRDLQRAIERAGDTTYLRECLTEMKGDLGVARWSSRRSLTIAIHPTPEFDGWSEDRIIDVRRAIDVWNGPHSEYGPGLLATTGFTLARIDDPYRSNIVLQYVQDPIVSSHPDPSDPLYVNGIAGIDVDRETGLLTRVIINIAMTLGAPLQGRGNANTGVICHELGHAFGIAGHSLYRGDLMYWDASGPPVKRDWATLKLLYRQTPGLG